MPIITVTSHILPYSRRVTWNSLDPISRTSFCFRRWMESGGIFTKEPEFLLFWLRTKWRFSFM